VSITVIAVNDAPVVGITGPADGSSFPSGTNIAFSGSASDVEDGDFAPCPR
jgi:hypothetical protein